MSDSDCPTGGWSRPGNSLEVDRSTLWGNPYRVGDIYDGAHDGQPIENNAAAVALFRDLLLRQDGFIGKSKRAGRAWVSIADIRRQLGGKNLACWCSPGAPCHADVLLELANPTERCD